MFNCISGGYEIFCNGTRHEKCCDGNKNRRPVCCTTFCQTVFDTPPSDDDWHSPTRKPAKRPHYMAETRYLMDSIPDFRQLVRVHHPGSIGSNSCGVPIDMKAVAIVLIAVLVPVGFCICVGLCFGGTKAYKEKNNRENLVVPTETFKLPAMTMTSTTPSRYDYMSHHVQPQYAQMTTQPNIQHFCEQPQTSSYKFYKPNCQMNNGHNNVIYSEGDCAQPQQFQHHNGFVPTY